MTDLEDRLEGGCGTFSGDFEALIALAELETRKLVMVRNQKIN